MKLEKFLPIQDRKRTIIGTVAIVSFLLPTKNCEEQYVDIKTNTKVTFIAYCLRRTRGSPSAAVLWNR